MRRYANRDRYAMAGYPEQPMIPAPSPSQLDAKDERLLEQSIAIGHLQGANDLLAEDNGRLEDENRKLREKNDELKERNTELERRDSAASAGYKSGQQLVDEIEAALVAKKESKK